MLQSMEQVCRKYNEMWASQGVCLAVRSETVSSAGKNFTIAVYNDFVRTLSKVAMAVVAGG